MVESLIGFVGVCVYHGDDPGDFLRAFESVLGQVPAHFVVGIYVDGTVPQELDKVIGQASNHKNTLVVRGGTQRGLAFGINELLKVGRQRGCTYFFRMDADDVSLPSRFHKQLAFMEANPHIDLCGGNIIEFQGEQGVDFPLSERRVPQNHDDIVSGLVRSATLNHPTVCFRYSSLLKYYPDLAVYDSSAGLAEDYQLWVDLACKGLVFANLNVNLLAFRVSPDFYRRRSKAKALEEHRVRLKAIQLFGKRPFVDFCYAYVVLGIRLCPPVIVKWAYMFKRFCQRF